MATSSFDKRFTITKKQLLEIFKKCKKHKHIIKIERVEDKDHDKLLDRLFKKYNK